MYPMFRKTVEALIKKYGNMSLEQFYRLQSKIIKIKNVNCKIKCNTLVEP